MRDNLIKDLHKFLGFNDTNPEVATLVDGFLEAHAHEGLGELTRDTRMALAVSFIRGVHFAVKDLIQEGEPS